MKQEPGWLNVVAYYKNENDPFIDGRYPISLSIEKGKIHPLFTHLTLRVVIPTDKVDSIVAGILSDKSCAELVVNSVPTLLEQSIE